MTEKAMHAYKIVFSWKPTRPPTDKEWETQGHLFPAPSMRAAAERFREALKDQYQDWTYYCWVMCCEQMCCAQQFKVEKGVAYEW